MSTPVLTHHMLVLAPSKNVKDTGHDTISTGIDGTDGSSLAEGPDILSVEGASSTMLPLVDDEKNVDPAKLHKEEHDEIFN